VLIDQYQGISRLVRGARTNRAENVFLIYLPNNSRALQGTLGELLKAVGADAGSMMST